MMEKIYIFCKLINSNNYKLNSNIFTQFFYFTILKGCKV